MRTGVNIHETDGGSVTEALPKETPDDRLRRAVEREKKRQERMRAKE